jgi:hypothetical protein
MSTCHSSLVSNPVLYRWTVYLTLIYAATDNDVVKSMHEQVYKLPL